MSNSLSLDRSYELAMSPTHFVLAGINSFLLRPHSISIIAKLFTQYICVVSECAYLKVEFDLALHINKPNMALINALLPEIELACRKLLKTMCHIINLNKLSKTYIHKIFVVAILDFRFLCISCELFTRLLT